MMVSSISACVGLSHDIIWYKNVYKKYYNAFFKPLQQNFSTFISCNVYFKPFNMVINTKLIFYYVLKPHESFTFITYRIYNMFYNRDVVK